MAIKTIKINLFSTHRLNKVLILSAGILLTGCSSWEPWVQPYEREILADPIMSFSRQPSIDAHFTHVNDIREGSHGASTSVGGGCGCN